MQRAPFLERFCLIASVEVHSRCWGFHMGRFVLFLLCRMQQPERLLATLKLQQAALEAATWSSCRFRVLIPMSSLSIHHTPRREKWFSNVLSFLGAVSLDYIEILNSIDHFGRSKPHCFPMFPSNSPQQATVRELEQSVWESQFGA